jgi:hypothetical protein
MEQLVPSRRVFVIVLRHVVRQVRQKRTSLRWGPLRGNETLYRKGSAG